MNDPITQSEATIAEGRIVRPGDSVTLLPDEEYVKAWLGDGPFTVVRIEEFVQTGIVRLRINGTKEGQNGVFAYRFM